MASSLLGERLLLFHLLPRVEAFGAEGTGDLPLIRIRGSTIPKPNLSGLPCGSDLDWISRCSKFPPISFAPTFTEAEISSALSLLSTIKGAGLELGDDSMSFPRLSRLTTGRRNMLICASLTTSSDPSESGAQRRKNYAIIASLLVWVVLKTLSSTPLLVAFPLVLLDQEEVPPPKILPPKTPTPFSSRTSATWLKNARR